MLLAEEATRESFANLPTWAVAFWYFLIFVSVGVFAWGVWRLARKYGRGRGSAEVDRPVERLAKTARIVFSHSWIRRRDPVSGLGHLFIFYGFLVLFVGTAILMVQDDILGPAGFEFFKGWFYKGYSLFLDVFGAALVAGLLVMAVKRGVLKPFRLNYRRVDREGEEDRSRYVRGDWLFLSLLFYLALSGFLLEAFRIAQTDPAFEQWSPLGWLVGQGFIDIGFEGGAAETAHRVLWWFHGLVALRLAARQRLPDAPLDGHQGEPDDEGDAEDVEEERVALVEPAREELEPGRTEDVVLDGEDRRSDEENEEAVEDEEVAVSRERVAAANPGVGQDDPRRPRGALDGPVDLGGAAPAAVLLREPPDAPGEDADRDEDEEVPERDRPGGQVRESLSGRFLG